MKGCILPFMPDIMPAIEIAGMAKSALPRADGAFFSPSCHHARHAGNF
jgi:hypothetical protein